MRKHIVDSSKPQRQGRRVQPQKYHSHVRVTMAHDQITKVSVVGDEDSPLGMGKCQDLVVSQTGLIVARDSRRVETKRTEVIGYSRITAFVNQKSEDTR
jgi:hypothetical protein